MIIFLCFYLEFSDEDIHHWPVSMKRRDSVGAWVRNFIADHVRTSDEYSSSPKKKILHHLMNGNIKDAINEAISTNFPNLAFALSTFFHGCRSFYQDQVMTLSLCLCFLLFFIVVYSQKFYFRL